jgi:hypothetical protein
VKTAEEPVTDKGYHSKQAAVDVYSLGLRSYISEPDRGGSTGTISTPSRT